MQTKHASLVLVEMPCYLKLRRYVHVSSEQKGSHVLLHQGKISYEARGGPLATCCGAKAFALSGCWDVVL